MSDDFDEVQLRRTKEIVAQVVQRRQAGERVEDGDVLAIHADIADLLRAELARASFNSDATDVSSPTPSFSEDRASSPNVADQAHTQPQEATLPERNLTEGPHASSHFHRFDRVRCHAVGGMGEVWLARDVQIRRDVALKLLKKDRKQDRAIRDRFLNEGYVTGTLEHPGIVPVYALGVDANQEPYYAMRFIRGESLRQAIKAFHGRQGGDNQLTRSNLAFRELLRRLADVCLTVAFAHSRGVLHRDLKPDNVMLGKFGETYVVDWGMARVLDAPSIGLSHGSQAMPTPESLHADSGTRYGSAMGTPGFMSPEQAAGKLDELSAATDIYSLGAILYFLLTNRVSITADTLTEFLRRVELGEIAPPTAVNAGAPKELCAVCNKAMAQLPANRYASAQELAADIESWLADEPLVALPQTLLQRSARFGRRHYRLLIPLCVATALVGVTAVMAAISIDHARRRAESAKIAEGQARQQAENNLKEARETVDEWLTGFSEGLAYYPGVADFRLRMLEKAAERYQGFLQQPNGGSDGRLEAGRTYLRLGDVRRDMRAFDAAIGAYGEAAKIFQGAQLAEKPEFQEALAQTYGRLALAYELQGEFDQALSYHQQAIATANELVQTARPDLNAQERISAEAKLADLEINRANSIARHGDAQQAANAFAAVVSRLQRLSREDSGRLETSMSLAISLLGWGQAIAQQGDSNKARDLYRQAANYFEGAARLPNNSAQHQKLRADANLYLATTEGMLGDYAAEERAYREVIDAYESLNAQLPGLPDVKESLAMVQMDLGQLLGELGRPSESISMLQAALDAFQQLHTLAPSVPQYIQERGVTLDLLSMAHGNSGNAAEAITLAEEALVELNKLASAWPAEPVYQLRAATCESHLAQLHAAAGRFDEADKLLIAAEERLDAAIKDQPKDPTLQYAAAVIASRRGESFSLAGHAAQASEQRNVADRHWQQLKTLSSDAKYFADAAWHYAMLPIDDKSSANSAREFARAATKQAPKNTYFAALAALAELVNNSPQACLAQLQAIPQVQHTPFSRAVANYAGCLAHAALGDSTAAKNAYDAAVATSQEQRGRWELRRLRQRCDDVLKSPPKKET